MEFSHINEAGFAKMVDVSGKEVTFRKAVAEGSIRMKREVLEQIKTAALGKEKSSIPHSLRGFPQPKGRGNLSRCVTISR